MHFSFLRAHPFLAVGTAMALAVAFATSASAVIFGVDAFDYPDGPIAGQTGGVSWDRTNAPFFSASGGPSNWDNVSGGPVVLLGRLVTNNSSAKREYKGSPEADGAVNDGAHTKAVYYRTTVTTGPVLPEFFGVSSYDFGEERIFFGKRFGAANFGIANSITGAFSDTSIPVLPNTTYVLVARVDYAANTLRLYVNPDLTAAEPAAASASLPWTHTEWSTAVRLASGNTGSAVTWDDITVATSWGDLALVVKSVADVDHGALGDTAQSLRDCLKYGPKGATILFAPGLDGATISLGSELAVTASAAGGDFIVDASALPNGITLNDGAADSYRLLHVHSGARLEVRGMTLAGAGASAGSIDGGAIRNSGTLTLTRCTLSGNAAGSGSGGALYSSGTLIASQCTFAGNSAASGGAVESVGDSRLVHCTLAGNSAAAFGGALRNSQGATTLLHCTIAENSAGNSGGGVASLGDALTQTLVRHSIIAGNTGGDVEFIGGAVNSFTSQNSNLIGTGNATGDFNQTLDLTGMLDPLLLPLGRYGGRTPTMPPLAGSPALERADPIAGLEADQRGLPRTVDGYNRGGGLPDSGAVEAAFRFVTSTDDPGAGSLRQALLDAAATPGWEAIAFDGALDGGTISLTTFASGSAIIVNDTGGVAIDASGLNFGLTITKPIGDYRLFRVNSGSRLSLHGLALTGGGSSHAPPGGAISSDGALTLTHCTLSGSETNGRGGAIDHSGPDFVALHSTFSGNRATRGGGALSISGSGLRRVAHCTFAGNFSVQEGGAISSGAGVLELSYSTVSANHSFTEGAIHVSGTLQLTNCIVAGNTASAGEPPDIAAPGSTLVTTAGRNLLSSLTGSGLSAGPSVIVGAPLLAPLGAYGGRTPTMPPRPGSPAIDAASGVVSSGDQRGRPRHGDGNADGLAAPDIGAVEAGIVSVLNADNSGAGSLRQALADAASLPGPDTIIFAPSLDGGTISLTTSAGGSALRIIDSGGVTIDASTLTHGLTLTKPPAGNYRLFTLLAGTLALDSLTLTGGNSTGGGGAIYNQDHATLTRCTLSGNTSTLEGGAVVNQGTFTLDRCTVSGNAGLQGGGLHNVAGATMMVVNSTIAGNAASDTGGGVHNAGALFLRHATIAENSAANDGGGIWTGGTDATLRLGNTILAGNVVGVPTAHSDLRFGGALASDRGNLIGASDVFPAGLPNVNDDFVGTAAAPLDPRLMPLGNYDGPTPTMPPLAGSRALDAGINFGLDTIDQRGRDRFADGNNDGNARPDSGAVEAAFRFVTTTDDSGPGSLREALAEAAAAPGWEAITFAPALDGGTISLTTTHPGVPQSGALITDAAGVAIDATRLPAGLTLTKQAGNFRLLEVDEGKRLSLHQLTLTGGSLPTGLGGALYNRGTLGLFDCTLTGNTARYGGAILSSTLPGIGGTEIRRCTLTGNTATTGAGGAINNSSGDVRVLFSTISGNSAPTGGGITSPGSFGSTVLASSIVSGNTGGDVESATGPDNSFTSLGYNLIGTGAGADAFSAATGDITGVTDPRLAPLARYGGPTATRPPLPGSPAIDAAGAAGAGTALDQRGFGRTGLADIGAAEFQGASDLQRWWLTDWDADGSTFGLEHALGTDPLFSDATDPRHPAVTFSTSTGQLAVTFGRNPAAQPGTGWKLQRSTNLITWTEIYRFDGTTQFFDAAKFICTLGTDAIDVIDKTPPSPRAFYRVEAASP